MHHFSTKDSCRNNVDKDEEVFFPGYKASSIVHTGVCAFEDNTVDEEKDKSSVKVISVRVLRQNHR